MYDAPNQQAVRADGSGPGEDAGVEYDHVEDVPDAPATLDEMTKAELLDYARELGVSPANNDMTKEELRAGIDLALAEA
jgi:hypothetical protein